LLLCGLLGDSVIRMLLTMASQYYRLIEIPEALFGVFGSLLAMGGFVMPTLARRLAERHTPLYNLLFTATLILLGLSGMCFVWPWVGLLPALLLFSCMYLMGFFLSHYLNQATSSDQRATVLSFKGLFLNLGYGGIGLLYALLLAFLREQTIRSQPELLETALKNQVFISSLPWFVGYFTLLLLLLLLVMRTKAITESVHFTSGMLLHLVVYEGETFACLINQSFFGRCPPNHMLPWPPWLMVSITFIKASFSERPF
jgi:hypothetical protein